MRWTFHLRINQFPVLFNPFQPSVAFYIATSHLFYSAKQMTGFYMECNTDLKRVKEK